MNATLLAIAGLAMQPPACPPPEKIALTTPVALRIQKGISSVLAQWQVKLEPGDVLASTTYFLVDGVPTSFHVLRSGKTPGLTRLFAICAAPWGEIMCGRDFYRSPGASPYVFIRQQGDRTLIVVRSGEKGSWRFGIRVLNQFSGMQKLCGDAGDE